MNGQGVGELEDSLILLNIDNRDDTGPLKYGMHVCLKSVYAKERYDLVCLLRYFLLDYLL